MGCYLRNLETEFLKLAAVYLNCRWTTMGNDITDRHGKRVHRGAHDYESLQWNILGMVDYAAEMRMIYAPANRSGNASGTGLPISLPTRILTQSYANVRPQVVQHT